MTKLFGAVTALGLASVLLCSGGKPASADVVVNNILSPFSVTVVGPGHRVYSHGSPWHHHHHHNEYTRCNMRWDPYWGEWRRHCNTRSYGENFRDDYYRPHYRARHGGHYGPYYRNDYWRGYP